MFETLTHIVNWPEELAIYGPVPDLLAAHIWAINFAINCKLHLHSGDYDESISCLKCFFNLI